MFELRTVIEKAECDECGCQLHAGDQAHMEKQDDDSVICLCVPCYPVVMELGYTIALEANLVN